MNANKTEGTNPSKACQYHPLDPILRRHGIDLYRQSSRMLRHVHTQEQLAYCALAQAVWERDNTIHNNLFPRVLVAQRCRRQPLRLQVWGSREKAKGMNKYSICPIVRLNVRSVHSCMAGGF